MYMQATWLHMYTGHTDLLDTGYIPVTYALHTAAYQLHMYYILILNWELATFKCAVCSICKICSSM
jgi:hypothetical protein